MASGGVKCWGRNGQGQLGDGTTSQRTAPVDVSGLTSGVAVISAGNLHTCAVTTSGGARCWGQNTNGQVGDNSTTQRNAPVDVNGLTSGAALIQAGGFHSCARLTSGAVKCWGLNDNGQLGDGTTTQRTIPVAVSGLTSGISGIAAGYSHTCAVKSTNSELDCWGSNSNGQLSDGSLTYSSTPLIVTFAGITYTYGDSNHKHAVTTLSTGESYAYDANGNMITRTEGGVSYTQVFDIENRLISVTAGGQTTQFIYDPDGNLIKKINPNSTRTLYVSGIYEIDKNSGGTITGTKTYYPAAGAMRIGSTLYYVLKDHLGSASVVTDASGNIVGEDRFYPYGETRLTTGTMLTDKLYTGQRQMAGLGIYHYGARFYSPYINRFLSADTIVPSYANPQSLNRYSYVSDNPLRYTDPTGHMQCEQYVGSCLSEKQVTKKYKEKLEKLREESRRKKDHETRKPDYITLNLGASIPGLGALVSGQLDVTLDQYGNLYLGPGIALGPEAPLGFSASLSAGYLDTWSNSLSPGHGIADAPNQQQSEQILSGWFANASVCLIFCGGLTNSLSNLNNVGFEVLGIGVPQLSVGSGYSFLIDFTDREEPIW